MVCLCPASHCKLSPTQIDKHKLTETIFASIDSFKDSKPLKEDDHLKILFQSKEVFEIFIEHVKPEDAGHYKCVAINPEGQDETAMQLKVTGKFEFDNLITTT